MDGSDPAPFTARFDVVRVPALRDRLSDIPDLAQRLASRYADHQGRSTEGLTNEAVGRLEEYPWPGNYAELKNVVERAVDLATGPLIESQDVRLGKARGFGQYELVRPIGGGGMGEVWLARHELLSRTAAIKVMRPHFSSNEHRAAAIRRFGQEAQATAKLRSPHTIELYDFGVTDDGAFYYSMEYLEGADLSSIVRRSGALPPERTVFFLKQACRSLMEAHAAGLVHRDIKPANLFAARLGVEFDFLKVLDFGLVLELGGPQTGPGLQGTPGYMAPEAVRGAIDPRSDLYALGCVAFEMIAGAPLFKGGSIREILTDQATREIPSLVGHSKFEIPPTLDSAIRACLVDELETRTPSAEALWHALDSIRFPNPWTPERAAAWWAETVEFRTPTERVNELSTLYPPEPRGGHRAS